MWETGQWEDWDAAALCHGKKTVSQIQKCLLVWDTKKLEYVQIAGGCMSDHSGLASVVEVVGMCPLATCNSRIL
jgi:hypothetical protein